MEDIDKIIYINLDRRKDRRQEIEQEFIRMNIPEKKVLRFSAINNTYSPGCGCTESHLEVLKLAKQNNYKNVLIMEDDFSFLVSKDKLNSLLHTFFHSKISYDVVMLSYNLVGKQLPYNDFLGKCVNVQSASGYLVHSKFYDALICNLTDALDKFMSHPYQHWLYSHDQYWKTLQPFSEWFYFQERIGKQRKSYSDLGGGVVDYGC